MGDGPIIIEDPVPPTGTSSGSGTGTVSTGPPGGPPRAQKTLYRFGVVETCYHQVHGQQPTGVSESRFSDWIESDEQPYGPRFQTIDEDWVPLDCGWIKDKASLLVLTNDPQDKSDEATVQVGVKVEGFPAIMFCEIPARFPSHSIRISRPALANLRVRSVKGRTRVTIVLYPA